MTNVVPLPSPALRSYRPKLGQPLSLPLYGYRVPAGFPSPADDYIERELDLHELLIDHPAATYYVRMSGDSMKGAGLINGDILVVDRSIEARHKSIVVAAVDGEFTVKRLWKRDGVVELRAENPRYQTVQIQEGEGLVVFGVVVGMVRKIDQ